MTALTTDQLGDLINEARSLRGLLEQRVAAGPDKVFLKWATRTYTYAEVDAAANAVANSFLACGIEPGDRVAVMMANSPEWVFLWLGAAKLGAITVTINTAYKGDGLAYQLSHSGSVALVVDCDLAERVAAVGEIPTLRNIFLGPGERSAGPARWRDIDELLAGRTSSPHDRELGNGSPCSILYTSGTTGRPKGCVLPHGQYLAAAFLHAANCGYDNATTLYTCLPLFHINAQNYSLLSAMAAGGTLALDTKFTASGFWDRLIEVQATAFNFIGSMAVSLWNQPPSPAERAHRAGVAFGVPIPPAIWGEWEERFACRVIYAYGMTENALPAIFPLEDTPAAPALRGAAGKASPTTEVAIVGDDDRPVPPATVGEIVTRPRIPFTMMLEYADRPDATIEAFRNCWFHTGDLGYLTSEGYLFYVDRKKDALRCRGEMVSSSEVEATVAKFPGVLECAVVGVPSELGEDEILVAVVTDSASFDPAKLVNFCDDNMARFMVPRYVRVVTELPRTQTQRVEKYRLRDAGITADTFDARPSTRRGP